MKSRLKRSRAVNCALVATPSEGSTSASPSFEELYRSSAEAVFAYACALLRDSSAAEEATASAFERAYRRQRMFMRFRAQFLDASGQWTDVPGADSGARSVGSAIYRARQSGWSFMLQPAAGAPPEQLRGEVDFEWLARNRHVLYRTQLFSTAGHPTGADGDPPNYNAATCTMS